MEGSSPRSNASVENRLGYTRSASMDSAGPPLAASSSKFGRLLAPKGDVDEDTANTSEHHKVGPLPDDAMIRNGGKIAAAHVSSVETKDTISNVPADSSTKVKTIVEVEPYKLSLRLDYAAYMIHLAVFGFFGVFTRYGLQKLFGLDCLALTSDQSPLYPDLPSNMLGSFLIAWFGIIFKADIRNISDHLIVGITTGYMGSLTTFSGWNQKMNKDILLMATNTDSGMFIVNESITVGAETGERLWSLIMKYIRERSSIVKVHNLADSVVLWMGCLVAPPGVWLCWYLAKLNGQGIGKQRSLKWLPIGTLAANVLAAGIMAALAGTSKAVHTKRSTTILSGIQLGFLGCLSTVSTFAAEVYTMRRSGQIARAFVYAASTFLLSFVLGTLMYSVPVWDNHYG
ncbi:hypothetical protein BAE44_0007684 [Dichanthelium oligosanthes]|uniref:Fluoride export protein 2 n=1 Tax=Dichanthelium oligosanthes TaxID=888268 RepID=A0A1E5W1T9_9POAL|nr:hypothetical protein BAE44_0007684 [Dichanthelium oligosanthes]